MILSSGRRVCANGDIFGLTKTGELTEGYDTQIYEDEDDPMTPDEKREIADTMIARWKAYRDKT